MQMVSLPLTGYRQAQQRACEEAEGAARQRAQGQGPPAAPDPGDGGGGRIRAGVLRGQGADAKHCRHDRRQPGAQEAAAGKSLFHVAT